MSIPSSTMPPPETIAARSARLSSYFGGVAVFSGAIGLGTKSVLVFAGSLLGVIGMTHAIRALRSSASLASARGTAWLGLFASLVGLLPGAFALLYTFIGQFFASLGDV